MTHLDSGSPRPGDAQTGENRSLRDPWLDNARLVAAVLIAVTHFSERAMMRTDAFTELWFATWGIRVPLFVVVAGYFSSAEPLTGRRAVFLLRNILGVYLVADLIASVIVGLRGGAWTYSPINPPFALWFLLSLFAWRALLPLLAHVRWIGAISVIAAVGVGFVEQIGTRFSAGRTIALFPLFLLGWYLRQRGLHTMLDRPKARPVAWTVLLAVAAFSVWLGSRIPLREFRTKYSYPGDLPQEVLGAGWRGLLLVVGATMAIAMLAVVPRRRLPFVTYLGAGSMYIYVLHAFVVGSTGIRNAPWYLAIDTPAEVALLIVASTAFALALASPPVRWALRWLIQPRYTWLFRDVPPTPPLSVRPVETR